MIKGLAGQKVGAQLVSATDGSAFTGSVTVAVTVDAGTQATGSVGSGACTHEGNGYHTYAPAQAETNGDLVAFTFTGTGAVPVTVQVYTRAGDAFTRLGAPAGASIAADIATVAGYIDTEVGAIKAKTDLIPASPATEGTLTTIASYIDTEVAAIKAKTDNLPSDPADASDIAAAFSTVNSTLATIASYIDTEVGTLQTTATAIKAKTDALPSDPADASDIAASFSTVNTTLATLATAAELEVVSDTVAALPTANQNADALLDRNISGGSSSGRTVKQVFHAVRNKQAIAAGTLTVFDIDDTTPSWTAEVTQTAGDPISAVDPA